MKFVVGLLCSSFFFVTMALSAHAAPPNATSIIVCNTKATPVPGGAVSGLQLSACDSNFDGGCPAVPAGSSCAEVLGTLEVTFGLNLESAVSATTSTSGSSLPGVLYTLVRPH
jgi:hypothetical protein